jgi:hypothetical protein
MILRGTTPQTTLARPTWPRDMSWRGEHGHGMQSPRSVTCPGSGQVRIDDSRSAALSRRADYPPRGHVAPLETSPAPETPSPAAASSPPCSARGGTVVVRRVVFPRAISSALTPPWPLRSRRRSRPASEAYERRRHGPLRHGSGEITARLPRL